MEFITNELLQTLCNDTTIAITQHSLYRLRERGIKYNDVKNCIITGEIIEQYPDDYPHPSCLIAGETISGQPLHVVVGTDKEYLWIITAYYPDIEKWNNDFKTRKELK